jgi:acyl-CoA thioester hydrolase
MRHDAWRREPNAYPLRGELAPRHTDVDMWQHLNNTSLISLHAENAQRWLRGMFGPDVWRQGAPVIAPLALATDFLAEGQYPAPLATGVRLLAVDADGFRLGSALFQHGQCVGLQDATLAVWADGLPQPLPADLQERLQATAARQPVLPGPQGAAPHQPPIEPVPVPQDFPWQLAVASRFADSDARGLTSDTSLARYAEQARVAFLTQTLGPERWAAPTAMLVGHVALRWRARGQPPVQWQLGCGVTRIGERSLAVRGALFDGNRCAAVFDSVMVTIDRQARRSTPVPEAMRAALAPLRLHRG